MLDSIGAPLSLFIREYGLNSSEGHRSKCHGISWLRGWEGGGASPILLEAKDITLIKVWGHGHITRKILWAHAALMQIENVGARQ